MFDSVLTIQWEAISDLLLSVISIVAFCLLCNHFWNNTIPWLPMKVFSTCSAALIFLSSIAAIWTNSLVLYDYNVMTSGKCNLFATTLTGFVLSIRWMITSFFVSCLRYFFVPTMALSSKYYYLWIGMHAFLSCFVFLAYIILIPFDERGVIITAADDQNVSLCFPVKHESMKLFVIIYVFFGEVVEQMILLYLYYKKYKQFINIDADGDDVTLFYKQNKFVSKRIMKRTLCLGISAIIAFGSCGISEVFGLPISPVPLAFGIQLFCIVFCFDIQICGWCNDGNNNVQSNDNTFIEMQNNPSRILQREEYLRNMMAAYYQTPNRRT
eukprot:26384_1